MVLNIQLSDKSGPRPVADILGMFARPCKKCLCLDIKISRCSVFVKHSTK